MRRRTGSPVARPRTKAYPPEVRERAITLYKSGQGYRTTARRIGVNEWTVRDWVKGWRAGQEPVTKTKVEVAAQQMDNFLKGRI